MTRLLLSFSFLLISVTSVYAQRKSELLEKIDMLETELDSVKTELFSAKKIEKASVAKAESLESQINGLKDANATLLTNLNNFATVSNKNSDIANTALSKLKNSEKRLKGITDAISQNDSTAIAVLTHVKQTLGEDAKVSVANGAVVISSDLASLFESEKDSLVSEPGKEWLQKIANILTANPKVDLTVEGFSMTGDLNLPAHQATIIANSLKTLSVDPNRIKSLGRDGNLKEGMEFHLHPNFKAFYLMVREDIKNGN